MDNERNTLNTVNINLIDMDCVHVVPAGDKSQNRKQEEPPEMVGGRDEQQTKTSPKSTAAQRKRRRARARKAATQKQQKQQLEQDVEEAKFDHPTNDLAQSEQTPFLSETNEPITVSSEIPEQTLPSSHIETEKLLESAIQQQQQEQDEQNEKDSLQKPETIEHLINISDERLVSTDHITTTTTTTKTTSTTPTRVPEAVAAAAAGEAISSDIFELAKSRETILDSTNEELLQIEDTTNEEETLIALNNNDNPAIDVDTDIIDLVTSNGFAGPITTIEGEEEPANVSGSPIITDSLLALRPSRLQFNTLSDGEDSEIDEMMLHSGPEPNITSVRPKIQEANCGTVEAATNSVVGGDLTASIVSSNGKTLASSSPITQPLTQFPKLDEGLSSEAELSSSSDEDDEQLNNLNGNPDDEGGEGFGSDADDEDDEQEVVKKTIDTSMRMAGKNGIVKGTANLLINGDETDSIINPTSANNSNNNNNSNINSNNTIMTTTTTNPIKSILQQPSALRSSEDHDPTAPSVKKQVTISDINQRLSSDTDIETDRLLGSQRSAPMSSDNKPAFNGSINGSNGGMNGSSITNDQQQQSSTPIQGNSNNTSNNSNNNTNNNNNNNTTSGNNNQVASGNNSNIRSKPNSNFREVLIEGVLFNVKYLGSTHTDCEGRGEKEDRIHQAEMAVHEVKMRSGDSSHQQAIEVQLFISTEKIMVLDDRHRKLLMDHSLRTISYIADIGDAIVLIVRTKPSSSMNNGSSAPSGSSLNEQPSGSRMLTNPRISCHVFESMEAHTITKSISQAFQVAYAELLKANGISADSMIPGGNTYPPKMELDYQQVLNSQEMSTEELEMFARRENQREVIVPKALNEKIGLSIVESGWGSVLPTVVIANIKQDGPADKCKKLSVGDQILSVNGISLVGLPLSDCQEILRRTKTQTVARLSVVPCPITVEVKIKRPDTKYQLGFSVQNGVVSSEEKGN